MGFVFEHQGMTAGLREPAVQVPPAVLVPLAVQVPLTLNEPAPVEPASRSSGAWFWGAVVGVFVAAGAAAAALLVWPSSEPSVLAVEEVAVPSPPPVEPERSAEVSTAPASLAVSTVENAPVMAPPASPPASPAPSSVRSERPRPPKTISPRSERRAGRTPDPAVVPATSEVTLTRFSATGSLTSVAVQDAISPLKSQLRRCHDELLQQGRDIKGRLAARLDIRGRSVESIDLQTPIDSVSLRACFRRVLLTAAFPAMNENDYAQARVEFFLLARRSPPR